MTTADHAMRDTDLNDDYDGTCAGCGVVAPAPCAPTCSAEAALEADHERRQASKKVHPRCDACGYVHHVYREAGDEHCDVCGEAGDRPEHSGAACMLPATREERTAQRAVAAIIRDCNDRRDLRFDDIDRDTRDQIRRAWVDAVVLALRSER